jgi:hypothetical protein
VAPAKNTSIAAEGKPVLTEEELISDLADVNAKMAKFSQPEEKLSNQEWKELSRLRQEKIILQKIQKAKAQGSITQEAAATSEYVWLKESKKRHPIMNYITQLKLRSHIWW